MHLETRDLEAESPRATDRYHGPPVEQGRGLVYVRRAPPVRVTVRSLYCGMRLALLWGVAGTCTHAGAESPPSRHSTDPGTGAEHWSVSREGIALELVQRRPEHVQAFYLGRGFPPELARRIADYCVISIGLRNEGPSPIDYDLSRWRYVTEDGVAHTPKAKEDWWREWQAQGVTFGFSQLSRSQTFQPGDWNSAMVTFDVPHGGRFDLHYQWKTPKGEVTGTIEEVHCAPDQP